MDRRKFIGYASSAASWLSLYKVKGESIGVVLRGGQCYREGGFELLDIGIDAAGRLVTGNPGSLNGARIIDVTGKVVSPGFIDILSDNTANPTRTYKIVEEYKVADGVTTALQMHGGSANCFEYYQTFGKYPHLINYGVSTAIMRVRYGISQLAERKRRVEKCLEEGALGVSHSIEYQPTPFDEIVTYASLAKKYNRTFFLHLRYSSASQELEGVDEAIRIAQVTGANLHIDHLHSTGGTFHMGEALEKIRAARNRGLLITCCVYPYSYWATYLHSKRFDAGWQEKYGLTFRDLRLVGTGERLTPTSFVKYREQKKLVAVPEGTLPLKETVDLALHEDFCMIGSDGGIEYQSHANSHPRGAGCFATALHHAGEIKIPLETMLKKITSLPRSLVEGAMKDRGILRDGAWADITVFDPATVNGKASIENPNQYSDGIEMVFVNGMIAYKSRKPAAAVGRNIQY